MNVLLLYAHDLITIRNHLNSLRLPSVKIFTKDVSFVIFGRVLVLDK